MPELPSRVPRATYRVQLHAGFTFVDARAIVPYLARLGISHLYVSPVLQARAGSTHGYDVVDHGTVNEELGGEDGFVRLTDALHAHGMGLVLDIVPNHMAINDPRNRWWWDVLEHGPSSRYAGFFDVDWQPPGGGQPGAILLPVLPDEYDRVLASGAIRLARRGDRAVVTHGELAFPIAPGTLDELVAAATDRIGPDADDTTALDAVVAGTNADRDALDRLLSAQPYRLAHWRVAARDLGYRRFFDVDELAGLRAEDPSVFAETHRRILAWVADGRVQGLRIDHPDGLWDPAGYVTRLREAAPGAWIVAEKILEHDERLPDDWPIDGTTGYEFANRATALLVDGAGEAALDARWQEVAAVGPAWDEIVAEAREAVLVDLLGSDVNRLAERFLAVSASRPGGGGVTRDLARDAIRAVAAAMPVYRTYVRAGDGHVSSEDAGRIARAVATASERRPELDPEVLAFLGRVLRLEVAGPAAGELAMRFQQLTPAAMAKGVEDTAFYRFGRLLALNEVGGDPGRFGIEADAFHDAMAHAAGRWPSTMLALSTHDTKRSADVRARLALLSEDGAAWRAAAAELASLLAPHRSGDDGPTDADVELLLQTLVGAWPIDADRAAAYMAKATREAKLRTSWSDPDPAYETAVERLVRGSLADPAFVAALEGVVAPLVEPGRRAALTQLALQLTAPGVPDVYQGTELWDLALVDPDNRRPVDYALRASLLDTVATLDAAAAWARADEGVPKLWLLERCLDLRRRRPQAFATGGYRSLAAEGPHADAVVAFVRGDEVATIVPRRNRHVVGAGWNGTTIALPDGTWRGLDGGIRSGRVGIGDLLEAFPVAVLERRS
jgi:(1->4)-alpha-D-glucan 1-alpha-D-glucosylmutase